MSLGASGCGFEYRNKGVKNPTANINYGIMCPHLVNGFCVKFHETLKTKAIHEFVNDDINCIKTVQVEHPIRLKDCK